jgi:chromosomal replication initiator protein
MNITQPIRGGFLNMSLRPMQRVMAEVSAISGVRVADILGPKRQRKYVRARYMAMAICRDYCNASYPQIGRAFHRHHSTVMYAMERIDTLMTDADLDDMEAIAERCGLVQEAVK